MCHDLALVRSVSHDMMIMYCGNIVEYLSSEKLNTNACHPYTRALLNCVFSINGNEQIISVDTGIVDNIDNTKCCPFSTKCEFCKDMCRLCYPQYSEIEKNHKVCCHIYN